MLFRNILTYGRRKSQGEESLPSRIQKSLSISSMERLPQHSGPNSPATPSPAARGVTSWPIRRLGTWSSLRRNRTAQSGGSKAIIKYNRRETLEICVIHLLPIAATGVLLFLNLSSVFFEPVGVSNQNARLNAIQFAAKLHEVSVTLSLSAIVLNYVQYQLLNGRGVPLSSLFAPFQISNLSSLWSPGLWATNSVKDFSLQSFLLVAIIVLSIILCATAGPASAILMMPSLGYWVTPTHFHEKPSNTLVNYFIEAPPSSLWPSIIDDTSLWPTGCNSSTDPMPANCPLGGFSTILDLATPEWYLSVNGLWNFTVQSPSTTVDVWNRYMQGSWVNDHGFVSETTSLFAGSLLGSGFTFSSHSFDNHVTGDDAKVSIATTNGPVLGPVVYCVCGNATYEREGNGVLETSSYWDGMDPSQAMLPNISEITFPLFNWASDNWSVDAAPLTNIWNSSTGTATLWFEPPDLGENTPSIGVVWAAFDNSTTAQVLSCSVYASWQQVDMYITPLEDNYIHSPTVDYSTSAYGEDDYLDIYSQQPINIDLDWANSALPPNDTIGQITQALSNSNDDAVDARSLGVAVSVFLADVISRVGSQTEFSDLLLGSDISNRTGHFTQFWNISVENVNPLGVEVSDVPMPRIETAAAVSNNYTEFKFTIERYGYAYSMRGLTRPIAAGILLAHVLVATIYMVLVLWFGWRCYGLRSMVDVVVLALSSPNSKTLDGSLGWKVEGANIYKSVVQVKEVGNRRLGFVFDGDGHGGERVIAGKRYARLSSIGKDDLYIDPPEKDQIREEVREVEVRDDDSSEDLEARRLN